MDQKSFNTIYTRYDDYIKDLFNSKKFKDNLSTYDIFDYDFNMELIEVSDNRHNFLYLQFVNNLQEYSINHHLTDNSLLRILIDMFLLKHFKILNNGNFSDYNNLLISYHQSSDHYENLISKFIEEDKLLYIVLKLS